MPSIAGNRPSRFAGAGDRGSLEESIQGFSSASLKRTRTVDKSAPAIPRPTDEGGGDIQSALLSVRMAARPLPPLQQSNGLILGSRASAAEWDES
jgi:hypothetical protein